MRDDLLTAAQDACEAFAAIAVRLALVENGAGGARFLAQTRVVDPATAKAMAALGSAIVTAKAKEGNAS